MAPSARFWFSEFGGRRKGLEPPPVSPPKAELRGEELAAKKTLCEITLLVDAKDVRRK